MGTAIALWGLPNLPALWETWVWSLSQEDPLTHGTPLQYSCLENPHGQRSLVGYSPWGHKEWDRNKWLHDDGEGTSLVVWGLRLYTSNAGPMGSTPGQGVKIPCAMWLGQKINLKKNYSKIDTGDMSFTKRNILSKVTNIWCSLSATEPPHLWGRLDLGCNTPDNLPSQVSIQSLPEHFP